MLGANASRSETAIVSTRIAAADALLTDPSEPGPRFPGEDGGRSLAEMAHADLDAALQLLADRAQYITGASGAAIALRRGHHDDMLCRASVGSNAPELGALLSMEYGLSGESVRTRQVLRCDDAERDSRVNREVCRELGIASVVVMPIVSEKQVLGVFELLSGKPRAFEERDLSALLRLCEMVETAVKHAVVAQVMPAVPAVAIVESKPQVDAVAADEKKDGARKHNAPKSESSMPARDLIPVPALPSKPAAQEVPPPKHEEAASAPKKALFWSAAMRAQSGAQAKPSTESIAVPRGLRNLQKCQACGFPVSQGRTFCVECEEKQWRGQPLPHPAADQKLDSPPPAGQEPRPQAAAFEAEFEDAQGTFVRDFSPATGSAESSEPASSEITISTPPAGVGKTPQGLSSPPLESPAVPESFAPQSAIALSDDGPTLTPVSGNSEFFWSSKLPSESWFEANKYILGALLVVAIVIGAIAWLH
ncbi:MAG: GAF domain-containing protein [Candidatus Sulfotelmatobacter sp.]